MDQSEQIKVLTSKALTLLARREHARYELKTKLLMAITKGDTPKEEGEAFVESVLESMEAQGYLSDERYAEMLLRSRSGRGYGPGRVRQELKQQRIASDIVQLCFDACEVDWFELAKDTKQRRFGESLELDAKQKAKQMRFLYGRGFTNDQIAYAMEGPED